MATRFFYIPLLMLLAGLMACSPQHAPRPDLSSFTGAASEDEDETKFITWDAGGSLNISPPVEVMQEITDRCKEKGYDLGFITSISLDENRVTAVFDCRGAG